MDEDPWYDGRLIQEFDPSQTRRYRFDAIQPPSRCLVVDADKVVSQSLDDDGGLCCLDRGFVFGNKNGLSRFDEDTAISLNPSTPRWWSGERVIWVHAGAN